MINKSKDTAAAATVGTTTTPPQQFTFDKFVPLDILDQHLSLIYDFNAIVDAEPECGINLLDAVATIFQGTLTSGAARGLLYAALKPAHPDVTLKESGWLFRPDTVGKITRAMAHAYLLSLEAGMTEQEIEQILDELDKSGSSAQSMPTATTTTPTPTDEQILSAGGTIDVIKTNSQDVS